MNLRSPVLIVFFAASALSQYAPGDLVITTRNPFSNQCHLLRITPTGKVSTIASLGQRGYITHVWPSPDNRTTIFAGTTASSGPVAWYSADPRGGVTTLSTPYIGTPVDFDSEGRLITIEPVALPGPPPGTGLVSVIGAARTSLQSYPTVPLPMAATIDPHSGDLIAFSLFSSAVLSLSIDGPSRVSTLVAGYVSNWPSVLWSPESDSILCYNVTFSLSAPHTLTTVGLQHVAATRTPRGTFVIKENGVAANDVYEFDPITRTRLKTIATEPWTTAMTIAHSRHLSGTGPAARNRSWPLWISFPAEPLADYQVGLSFRITRGLQIAPRARLFLAPDPLLTLSIAPGGPYPGLRGTLDWRGEAQVGVPIPGLPSLAGRRLFAQVFAHRSGRVVAASLPLGVTIR